MRLLPFLLACLAATACTQVPQARTVRICDADGCGERARSSASPSENDATEDPDGRISRLVELAQRDSRAAYDLGLRYFRGDGVRQDRYKSLTWMRDAAERGHLGAQKALGRFYLTGLEEMGADAREAERWLSAAASQGDKEAARLLAEARTTRQSDERYRKWQQHWRSVLQDSWYRSYVYLGDWRDGHWHYR